MKIFFNINYRTQWGQTLYICGNIPQLGDKDVHKAQAMHMVNADSWAFEVEAERLPETLKYFFIVKPESGEWRFEWGDPHVLITSFDIQEYNVFTSWEDMPGDKPYYSSAFVDGILNRKNRDLPLRSLPSTVRFKLTAPMVQPNQVVAICGEPDSLGAWDVKRALRMNDANYPVWEVDVPTHTLPLNFDYKFVILDKNTGEVAAWEERDNRTFGIDTTGHSVMTVVDGLRIANPYHNWKGAGTAIPVFSIRTEDDFGVGDFTDIKKMVDWCRTTGQKMLQLLPINDTTLTGTWLDSYPYRANSTFALHPMFMRLDQVGRLANQERMDYYYSMKRELNALPDVDYERVNNVKNEYLHEIYAQEGEATAKTPEYAKFVAANEYWLRPYAAWSLLRDIHHTPENDKWGQYATYDKQMVDEFIQMHRGEIGYYYFVQYHLDKQLREAVAYARENEVVLKGDIPIGIGRYSVDAWLYPHLFNMNSQAGAPPDDFSVLGQNWGFPTYNWEEMARDGFAWWKARFIKMSEYFDAYRIDHILGFFRIWQIPIDALHGLLGVFNPALPFTPEELRHNYDFWLNVDLQTNPLILEWMLSDFFGAENVGEVKERFLEPVSEGRYRLKDYVNTQLKVADYFATQEKDDKNNRFCNALMGLIDDVLFIEDPVEKGKYHPRISAQFTYQYRILTDYERWCFDRLYNDFFYRRHNDFWYGKAMWKLPPLLDSTRMLTCAEDLGMIPDCVPAVMQRLEILSLEIQRMPKNPKLSFGHPWEYPYYSVCTTSTHDMGGIRQWWEENRDATQRFYNEVLHEHGEAPHYAEPWVCDKIIDQHLYSPSMLCIIPLQDWLSTDGAIRRNDPREEQINVPANPTHYWKYRMHLTVENLLGQNVFNEDLRSRIHHSGR